MRVPRVSPSLPPSLLFPLSSPDLLSAAVGSSAPLVGARHRPALPIACRHGRCRASPPRCGRAPRAPPRGKEAAAAGQIWTRRPEGSCEPAWPAAGAPLLGVRGAAGVAGRRTELRRQEAGAPPRRPTWDLPRAWPEPVRSEAGAPPPGGRGGSFDCPPPRLGPAWGPDRSSAAGRPGPAATPGPCLGHG
ncbi:hypothetical protein PVAP13_1KG174454 [Panicum virgatum]|uniref:Uncharacterized protein n=1 Tax=Panicum virgatum TaxID=38727 RepID=A0A8T0XBL5_PANVG|nr:hypothetical protein PVAP13_1KG174454 [Panicum virgatum]